MPRYSINPNGIDAYLWAVEKSANKIYFRNPTYPFRISAATEPLRWWVLTGRASVAHLRAMITIRPDVLARILLKETNFDAAVNSIRSRIEQKMEVTT